MPLTTGTRLGPYEITGPLGAGGMGEVYRARDTKLKRDVALKVLPDAFARDPERLARFQREAQVLASLNHPNIARDLRLRGQSAGVHALVLELVEGPTLADRIAQGPIPVDEALPIAQADRRGARSGARAGHHPSRSEAGQHQGAARRHGEGAGLRSGQGARSRTAAQPASDVDGSSPTITSPAMMTGVGVMLGTAAYMAPEQAKGQSGRQAQRHLGVRLRAVRDADGHGGRSTART